MADDQRNLDPEVRRVLMEVRRQSIATQKVIDNLLGIGPKRDASPPRDRSGDGIRTLHADDRQR